MRADRLEEHVYRDWRPVEVLDAVRERLKEKDSKTLHGGPFDEIVVVIHTDEPVISPREYESVLRYDIFCGLHQITVAYVFFSYDPEQQGYPLVSLQLERSPPVSS